MSIVLTDDTYYQDIANAIRNKNGTTTQYKPSEMAAAINAISTGGGDTFRVTTFDYKSSPISARLIYSSDANGTGYGDLLTLSDTSATTTLPFSGSTYWLHFRRVISLSGLKYEYQYSRNTTIYNVILKDPIRNIDIDDRIVAVSTLSTGVWRSYNGLENNKLSVHAYRRLYSARTMFETISIGFPNPISYRETIYLPAIYELMTFTYIV